MKSKRRQNGHSVFMETVDEFRKRFLNTLKFKLKDWKSIFSGISGVKISLEEIMSLLLENEPNVRLPFENHIMDKEEEDEEFSSRLTSLFELYFGHKRFSRRYLLISIDKFFSSKYSVSRGYQKLRRKEEIEMLEKRGEVTHIQLCGIDIPLDVFLLILSYITYDKSLFDGIALVNESWFRVILQTWKRVIVGSKYMSIPILVFRNVTEVIFKQGGIEDYNPLEGNCLNLEYCLKKFLNLSKLKYLDFSYLEDYLWHGYLRKSYSIPNNHVDLSLPSLEFLGLPPIPRSIWIFSNKERVEGEKILSEKLNFKNLNRLTSLKCDIVDLKIFKEIFPQLRCLQILISGAKTNDDSEEFFVTSEKIRSDEYNMKSLEDLSITTCIRDISGDAELPLINLVEAISNIFTSNAPNCSRLSFSNQRRFYKRIEIRFNVENTRIRRIDIDGDFVIFNNRSVKFPSSSLDELNFITENKLGSSVGREAENIMKMSLFNPRVKSKKINFEINVDMESFSTYKNELVVVLTVFLGVYDLDPRVCSFSSLSIYHQKSKDLEHQDIMLEVVRRVDRIKNEEKIEFFDFCSHEHLGKSQQKKYDYHMIFRILEYISERSWVKDSRVKVISIRSDRQLLELDEGNNMIGFILMGDDDDKDDDDKNIYDLEYKFVKFLQKKEKEKSCNNNKK